MDTHTYLRSVTDAASFYELVRWCDEASTRHGSNPRIVKMVRQTPGTMHADLYRNELVVHPSDYFNLVTFHDPSFLYAARNYFDT